MALVTSTIGSNFKDINLHDIWSDATSRKLSDASYTSKQGYTYDDTYTLQESGRAFRVGGDDLESGSGGAIVDGTAKGMVWQRSSGDGYTTTRAIEGFSVGADDLYRAMRSSDTADDRAVLERVLSGSDTFRLSDFDDIAHGRGGNDKMYGGGGDDWLCGGSGSDRIDGGSGADTLCGGSGNDLFKLDNAGDRVVEYAGDGWDTVHSTVSHTLGSNVEAIVLKGTSAKTVNGNGLDNRICGNRISNSIDGGSGDDTLTGWNGNDTIKGGSGDDLFRFKTAPNETYNVDRILDFVSADDRIGIDNKVFAGLGGEGALADSKFHLGSRAHDSTDRVIYDRDSGKLYYDADGTGSADAILFARFDAGTKITADDVFVV